MWQFVFDLKSHAQTKFQETYKRTRAEPRHKELQEVYGTLSVMFHTIFWWNLQGLKLQLYFTKVCVEFDRRCFLWVAIRKIISEFITEIEDRKKLGIKNAILMEANLKLTFLERIVLLDQRKLIFAKLWSLSKYFLAEIKTIPFDTKKIIFADINKLLAP